MKTLYVLLLYGMLHGSLVIADTTDEIWTSLGEVFRPYPSTLTHRVGRSPLVVVGTVTDTQSLWRGEQGGPTTDFTIQTHAIIKGTTNAGEDTVKFLVLGGQVTDPRTGRQVAINLEYHHEIEIGDTALFFFSRSPVEWRNKIHPYQGLYLHPSGKFPIDNKAVRLPLLEAGALTDIVLPVDLVVALGKATVVDRETAILIEGAIQLFMASAGHGAAELPEKLIERVIFTCENLLEGYEAGTNIAMKKVQRGDADTITHVSSQTFAEKRGYCRGFVDTMRHHFDVDYYCICGRHWSYQIKRPEK